ncbi:hypothetical protein BTO18_17330 [Polaribacter porphyrae]|uniref:DoxX family protein n=2 Tax=Polaribacter porphyrae TaxID=1137780 RepID=A0A2S7WT98_9FLAO|nr:hypothetical protein BTO18_17330 [Polaribacter porphyrae]
MDKNRRYWLLTILILVVWFINGFYCKILNQVPRHQEIVSRVLSDEYAREITFTIGVLEVFMVVWILSNYKSKFNAISQIIIIITMNIIEFILAKEILLFGSLNLIFATLFCGIINYQEFILKEKCYA